MTDDLSELSGVGDATEEKLINNGYKSYVSIAVADPTKMANKADLGESTAQKIIRSARNEADLGGFDTASEVMNERSKMHKISTQVPAVDELMDGGIETQAITEFYGEFGSGKSQITHQMAVNCQLPEEHGGAEGSCIFVDTEESFRPKRIFEMVRGLDEEVLEGVLEHRGFDYTVEEVKTSDVSTTNDPSTPAEVVGSSFTDNIHLANAFNSNHQMLVVKDKVPELAGELEEDPDELPLKLLVVDSLTAHFRSEYVGRGSLANRQQELNKHLQDITTTINTHNAAAILANQVQSNPAQTFGDPTDPIGGNILGHRSTFRIYLKKSSEDKRIWRLDNAPNLADGEAVLRIKGDGVRPE